MNDNQSNGSMEIMEHSRFKPRRSERTLKNEFLALHKKYWIEERKMPAAAYNKKYARTSTQGYRMNTAIKYDLYKLYLAFRTRLTKEELLKSKAKWPFARGPHTSQKTLSCEVSDIGHSRLFKTFRKDFGYDDSSVKPFDYSQFNTLPLAPAARGDASSEEDALDDDTEMSDDDHDFDNGEDHDFDLMSNASEEVPATPTTPTTTTTTPTTTTTTTTAATATLEAFIAETRMSDVSASVHDEAVDFLDRLKNHIVYNSNDTLGDVAKSIIKDIEEGVLHPQRTATSQERSASYMTRTALLGENGAGKSFLLNALLCTSSVTPYEYERLNGRDTDPLDFEGAVMLKQKLLEGRDGSDADDAAGQVRDAIEYPPEAVMDENTGLFVASPDNKHYACMLQKEEAIEAATREHATGTNARDIVGNSDGSGAYLLPSQRGTASTTRCPIAVRPGRRFEAVIEQYSISDMVRNCKQTDWDRVEGGEVEETSVFSSGKRIVDMVRRAEKAPSRCSYPAGLTDIDGSDVDVHSESSEATMMGSPVTADGTASKSALNRHDTIDDDNDSDNDDVDFNCDLDLTPAPKPIDRALIDKFTRDPQAVVHRARLSLLGKHRLLRTHGKNLLHDRLYLRETLKTLLDDDDALFFKRITVFVPSAMLREWNTELVDAPGCNDSDAQKVSTLVEVLGDSDHVIVVCPQRLSSCKSLASVIREHLIAPNFENDIAGTHLPHLLLVWHPERHDQRQLNEGKCEVPGEWKQWRNQCWEDLKNAAKKVACGTAELSQEECEKRIIASLERKLKFAYAFPLLFSSLVATNHGIIDAIDNQHLKNMHNTGVPAILFHIHKQARQDPTLCEHTTSRSFLAILEKSCQMVAGVEAAMGTNCTLAATVGKERLPLACEVQKLLHDSSARTAKKRKSRLLAASQGSAAMYAEAEEVLTTWLVQDRQIDGHVTRVLAEHSKTELFVPFRNACTAWTSHLQTDRSHSRAIAALSRAKAAASVEKLFFTGDLDCAPGLGTLHSLLMALDGDLAGPRGQGSLAVDVFDMIKGRSEKFERKVLGKMVASAVDKVLVAQIVKVGFAEVSEEELRSVTEKMVFLQTQGACDYGRRQALNAMACVLQNFQVHFFGARSNKITLVESMTRAVNQCRVVAVARLREAEGQNPAAVKSTLCSLALEVIGTAIGECLPVMFSEHLVATYRKHKGDIEKFACARDLQQGFDLRKGRRLARNLRTERNRLIDAMANTHPEKLPEDTLKKMRARCQMMMNLVREAKKKVEQLDETKEKRNDGWFAKSVKGMVRSMVLRARLRHSWAAKVEEVCEADHSHTFTTTTLESVLARSIPLPPVPSSTAMLQVESHACCTAALVEQLCEKAKDLRLEAAKDEKESSGPSTLTGVVSERACSAGRRRTLDVDKRPLVELCEQLTGFAPELQALWQETGSTSLASTHHDTQVHGEHLTLRRRCAELVAIRLATMVVARPQRYGLFVCELASFLGDKDLVADARNQTLPLAILAHCCGNAAQSVRTSYVLGWLLLCVMVDAFGEPFEVCLEGPVADWPTVRIAAPNASGVESRRKRPARAYRVGFDMSNGRWALVPPAQIVLSALLPWVSTTTTTITTTDHEMRDSGSLKRRAWTEEKEGEEECGENTCKKKKARV